MSIRALAAEDNTEILDMDGDSITLTLSTDSTETYTVKGHYNRIGLTVDPGTGLPVQGNNSNFTVSLQALVTAGLTDVTRLQSEKWIITAADVLGSNVAARTNDAMLDRTLGQVTIFAKV